MIREIDNETKSQIKEGELEGFRFKYKLAQIAYFKHLKNLLFARSYEIEAKDDLIQAYTYENIYLENILDLEKARNADLQAEINKIKKQIETQQDCEVESVNE